MGGPLIIITLISEQDRSPLAGGLLDDDDRDDGAQDGVAEDEDDCPCCAGTDEG